MVEEEVLYDFICLCCGARNGEKIPSCSFHKYVKKEGDLDSEEFTGELVQWLASPDYKGSILLPSDFLLEEEYRLRIVEMTAMYRSAHRGIILFGLPGAKLPAHAVSLAVFLN